jgi:hypothetical protein
MVIYARHRTNSFQNSILFSIIDIVIFTYTFGDDATTAQSEAYNCETCTVWFRYCFVHGFVTPNIRPKRFLAV